jgi:tRNA threonylcarbamoyladenosine modification (KEOPS) complex  Pcc1 subunit
VVRMSSDDPEPRPAFYALSPGGWRDYWTLLHPPYTLWHLSYVAIGASLAPVLNVRWLAETLVAFLLAMGIGAHALDELHGRPLGTRIPDGALVALAVAGVAGAVALGVHGAIVVSPWILAFIAVGVVLVPAYNLEWFGGALHSDRWFAVAWGAFPALTAFFAQTGRLTVAAVAAAGSCVAVSSAQRALSTPVRRLRRHVERVEGTMTMRDGAVEPVDAAALRAVPESALRLLSIAMPLIGLAMVLAAVARS